MWEALNRFHLDVQRPNRGRVADAGAEHTTRFCRSIVDFLQGITDSTMPREESWYFLQAGKFLERAEWTTRTIDVNYRLLVGEALEHGDRHALAVAGDLQPWGTLLRALALTASTGRPARLVTKFSCRCSRSSLPRARRRSSSAA